MTFLPNSFSVSLRAFPATLPPLFATFLFLSKVSGFSVLEISVVTLSPNEYKNFKNLPQKSKTNLRDHMDDLELIFTMLGERVTTEISKTEKPDTFDKNKKVAKRGGKVAGNARKDTEKELGRNVITKTNFTKTNSLDTKK